MWPMRCPAAGALLRCSSMLNVACTLSMYARGTSYATRGSRTTQRRESAHRQSLGCPRLLFYACLRRERALGSRASSLSNQCDDGADRDSVDLQNGSNWYPTHIGRHG
jgi:hypothetical protein